MLWKIRRDKVPASTPTGYPGIMVTDTAPFRYPYYHTTKDTIEKIDFDRTARVVEGMRKVIESLADTGKP